jgi:hypothetical protein
MTDLIFNIANYTGGKISVKISDSTGVNTSTSTDIDANYFPLNIWNPITTTGYDSMKISFGDYEKTIDLLAVNFPPNGLYYAEIGIFIGGEPSFIEATGRYLSSEAMNYKRLSGENGIMYGAFILEKKNKILMYVRMIFFVLAIILILMIACMLYCLYHKVKGNR